MGDYNPLKTYGLLLDPLRHVENSRFDGIIFRKSMPEIRQQGGLWDKSMEIYPLLNAVPHQTYLRWTFPSGATIRFAHLQYAKTVLDYQGSEIPFLAFDELTHFDEGTFFYMLTRNRSTSGVRGYVRGTCNPDPESWVAAFIDWWINPLTGFPIPERSGVIRWFVRDDAGTIAWADDPDELKARYPHSAPKSATFIPSKLTDNPILMQADPDYLANLMAQDPVTRARLLDGNWKVKAQAGDNFNRAHWGEPVDPARVPHGGVACRYFDFASTKKERTKMVAGKKDPDYTAGFLTQHVGDLFYQWDSIAVQYGPAEVDALFFETIEADLKWARQRRVKYRVRWEEEPGATAKKDSARTVTMIRERFSGRYGPVDAAGVASRVDKAARALTFASEVKVGHVLLVKDSPARRWNERYLTHMHHQYDWPHDDEHDASVGSFNEVAGVRPKRMQARAGGSRSAPAPTPATIARTDPSVVVEGGHAERRPTYSPYATGSVRERITRKGQPKW